MSEKDKKVTKGILSGCFGCFGLIIILGIIIGACTANSNKNDTKETTKNEKVESNINTNKQNQKSQTKKENDTTPSGDWKVKIKEVANKDGNENAKFNEIDQYAYDYKPSNKEVSEFTTYIIDQYKSGKYLKDISNNSLMLENIFKASVVDNHFKNDQGNPYGDFAFDFYQNSKYVYRGAETIGSEFVMANERQMDKALVKIKNKE